MGYIMAVCGIYKITEKETGKCYIGQSKDIYRRLREHATKKYDESDWHSKYQCMPEKYTFEILTRCRPEDLDDEESYYIYKYNAVNQGLNKQDGNHTIFSTSNKDIVATKEQNVPTIFSMENINEEITLNNDNNKDLLLHFNPTLIFTNSKSLTAMDTDVLVYLIYCTQLSLIPVGAQFISLFSKNDNSGDSYLRYNTSFSSLINNGFINTDRSLKQNFLDTSTINIDIHFQKYCHIKITKGKKFCLYILCLLDYLKKNKMNTILLNDFQYIKTYPKPADLNRYVLNPTIDLLNQYYYSNPIHYEFIKEKRKSTKIKFIF